MATVIILVVTMFIISAYCAGSIIDMKEKENLFVFKSGIGASCAAITVINVAYNIVCLIIILRIL